MRTESELVLESRSVVPGRLSVARFQFHFSDWPAAAADLVRRCRTPSESVKASEFKV
jgi:NAD dependent epimerase/dehydratase family enzyme